MTPAPTPQARTSSVPNKPVPVPDALSAGYWAAAARQELAIARCPVCRTYSIPPDNVCRTCSNTEQPFEYQVVSGNGNIRSWTIIRMAFLPGFKNDVPYVIVDVELDEQPDLRMLGRLTDGVEAPLRIGARVHVSFDTVVDGVFVPSFTLQES